MLAPADVALTPDGLTAYVIDIIQKCAFKFQYGEFTYVEDKNNNSLPKEFVLAQNVPNPFNPSTFIYFNLPKASKIKLVVTDPLGKVIAN